MPVLEQSLLTINRCLNNRIKHIQQWLVVFIYQHNSTETSLPMSLLQYTYKSIPQSYTILILSINCFLSFHKRHQCLFQHTRISKVITIKVEVEHWILLPLLLLLVDGKPLEQLLLAFKITLQGRNEQ